MIGIPIPLTNRTILLSLGRRMSRAAGRRRVAQRLGLACGDGSPQARQLALSELPRAEGPLVSIGQGTSRRDYYGQQGMTG